MGSGNENMSNQTKIQKDYRYSVYAQKSNPKFFFQKYGKKVSKKLADLKRDLDSGSKMHMPVTSLQPSLT